MQTWNVGEEARGCVGFCMCALTRAVSPVKLAGTLFKTVIICIGFCDISQLPHAKSQLIGCQSTEPHLSWAFWLVTVRDGSDLQRGSKATQLDMISPPLLIFISTYLLPLTQHTSISTSMSATFMLKLQMRIKLTGKGHLILINMLEQKRSACLPDFSRQLKPKVFKSPKYISAQ